MKYILVVIIGIFSIPLFAQESIDGQKKTAGEKKDTGDVVPKSSNNYIAEGFVYGIPVAANRIYFSEIDSVEATKDELFFRGKAFLTKVFPNFSNVVKVDDKDLGKISVRGLYRTNLHSFFVNTTIQVKDNKYKYEFSDFIVYPGEYGLERYMTNEKRAKRLSNDIVPYLEAIISTLKKEMRSKPDNW